MSPPATVASAQSQPITPVAAAPSPPKEIFPGILDPGPPPKGSMNIGILMPLNLTRNSDAYWRSVTIAAVTAIRLAVSDINEEKMLPVNMSISLRNSQPPKDKEYSGSNAMLQTAMFVESNVSAVIGDTRSWLTEYSATLTHFVRTVATTEVLAENYLDYIRQMNWHRIGIIFSDDSFGRSMSVEMARFAPLYGVTIILSEPVYVIHTADDIRRSLNALRRSGAYVNLVATTDEGVMSIIREI
ncbi:hypothetical protein BGZ94_007544 [Podila epigama]|nr:hypothetical protein BGZ94_007544 [Podila epigama]